MTASSGPSADGRMTLDIPSGHRGANTKPWSSNLPLDPSAITVFYEDIADIPGLVDKATAAAAIAADRTMHVPARLTAAGEAIVHCVTISRECLRDHYMKPLIDAQNLMRVAEHCAPPRRGFQLYYNIVVLPIVEPAMRRTGWDASVEASPVRFESWAPLVGALDLSSSRYRQNLLRSCFELTHAFDADEEVCDAEMLAAAEGIARALVHKSD